MESGKPRFYVAVASGKGGVGKSTVSTNLAVALTQLGWRVGLLDADIYGPSQRQLLGVAEGTRPVTEGGNRFVPITAHGVASMSMAYLTTLQTPMAWRGPMASGALLQMLEQTHWGDLDVLLIDMPPGTGDIQLTLGQKIALSGAVIVTTPQDMALLDARKGIELFAKIKVPILGIIENMAWHVCGACGHEEPIFGAGGGHRLEQEYHVPLLAQLPLSGQLRELADTGQPIVTTAPETEAARALMAAAKNIISSLEESQPIRPPRITMSDDEA